MQIKEKFLAGEIQNIVNFLWSQMNNRLIFLLSWIWDQSEKLLISRPEVQFVWFSMVSLWKTLKNFNYFFQILWKSRCHISWMVTFPSHLIKVCSKVKFWYEKLNCGFFHSFHSRKTPQNNFSWQNFSVENNYFYTDFLSSKYWWGLGTLAPSFS